MLLKSKHALIAFFFFPVSLFSQARLMMNNNIYLVMNNEVNIVLENPNSNAITETGIGSHIISEHENNKLHWLIGNQTGTYLVPFTTQTILQGGNETRIPFEVIITNAGDNGGKIVFSTYETTTDLNVPWASDVTHMNNNAGSDNSLMVADRFWMIDAETYSTKPDVELYFYYEAAANELAGTNTITETNLIAQRFNSSQNKWGDYTGGIVNTAIDRMEQVIVPAADFYRTWVLVDNSSWLPIELIDFNVKCDGSEFIINWSTASETNSDYFIIHHSQNSQNWIPIDTVIAAGFSVQTINYQITMNVTTEKNYFRLVQVDKNGKTSFFNPIYSECNDENLDLLIYPNPSNGIYNLIADEKYFDLTFVVFNGIGEIILKDKIKSNTNEISISNYPNGIYFIHVIINGDNYISKLIKN